MGNKEEVIAGMSKRGIPRITRRVKVCASKGCRTVAAVVDTGATITTLTEGLAKSIGVKDTMGHGTLGTASGKIRAWGGQARICLPDRGCGCLDGKVAVVPVKDFGDTRLLLGQDYLEASGAMIDAARRSIRCRTKRSR